VGKVTLKSNSDEALSDESILKSKGDEALNDDSPLKSNGNEALNVEKNQSDEAIKQLTLHRFIAVNTI
jgi:hypothetical protein